MRLSPFTPSVVIWLAYLQCIVFVWDGVLRVLSVWLTSRRYAHQKAQSRHLQAVYSTKPFRYVSGGMFLLLFVGLPRITASTAPGASFLFQGLWFGLMGVLTVLPLWWCRGLLRVFLVGQGLVVTVLAVGWRAAFAHLTLSGDIWILNPMLPLIFISCGGYTVCFVITAQWRRFLPLSRDPGAGPSPSQYGADPERSRHGRDRNTNQA